MTRFVTYQTQQQQHCSTSTSTQLLSDNNMSKVVCVTGGSGCIGSWLVHLLLHRGYTVHATVQNLNDDNETKHLQALEGAQTNLRLFQIDLLNYDTVLAAVHGCDGVFHLASPCIVDKVRDPQVCFSL